MDFTAGLTDPTQTFKNWYSVTQPLRDMRAQEKQDALDQSKLAIAQQTADLAKAKAQAEADRQQELQDAATALQQNDTAENRLKFLTLQNPDQMDKVSTALNSLDTATRTNMALGAGQVVAAIKNGHPEMAWDQLQSQADGYRAAGQEDKAKQTEALIASGKINPDFVTNYYGSVLAYFPEGQKVWDQLNKNSEQPFTNDLKSAQAEEARAHAAQMLGDAAKAKGVPDTVIPMIKDASEAAQSASVNSKTYAAIASKLGKIKYVPAGILSKGWDATRQFLGIDAGDWQDAQNQFNAAKTQNGLQYIAMLRPASDADMKLVMQGWPHENDPPTVKARFLNSLSKVMDYQSKVENFKGKFLTENRGNLGEYRGEDTTIGGVSVKKGDSFFDAVKRGIDYSSIEKNAGSTIAEGYGEGSTKPKETIPAAGATATPAPKTPAAPQKTVTVDF